MNYRHKIIKDNLDFLERCESWLNEWETSFCKSIREQHIAGRELSQKQFNTLQDVVKRVAGKVA